MARASEAMYFAMLGRASTRAWKACKVGYLASKPAWVTARVSARDRDWNWLRLGVRLEDFWACGHTGQLSAGNVERVVQREVGYLRVGVASCIVHRASCIVYRASCSTRCELRRALHSAHTRRLVRDAHAHTVKLPAK